MNTPANLKDVAEAAGVSISTASRALAGKTSISEKTRSRVQQVARELNYQPNVQARGLRSARTNIIGLTIPSLTNPYFATMAATIQERAAANGHTTLITTSNEDPEQLKQAIYSMSQMRVDGMIVVPSENSKSLLMNIHRAGTPVVLIDRELPGTPLPSYASQALPGITAAVAELAARGHTRIGYLSGPVETSTGAQRLAAFEQICAHTGTSNDFIFRGGYDVKKGWDGAQALLHRGITALIAGDSMMTFGALDYCYQHGINIGTDLAFVGFDDLVYMSLQPAPISVIDQNVVAMSEQAYDGLVRLIGGADPPDQAVVLDTTYISRASTHCTPPTTTRR